MKMKRYEQGSIGMRTDKEGAWCKYEDAQKLQAENAALRTQLAEVTAKGIASIKEALALQPCPEVLNKVRAEAVRRWANYEEDGGSMNAFEYADFVEKGEA